MNDAAAFDAAAMRYLRDDEHWGADIDVLKDALESVIEHGRIPLSYLDVGCGPAFHLAWLTRMYRGRGGLRAYGLDQSKAMLEEAARTCDRLELNVGFIESGFFEYEARERWSVVSCLNNTLGNMVSDGMRPSDVREHAVGKLRSLTLDGGYLVLSVYNKERFSENYGRTFTVLEKSDKTAGEIFLAYTPRPSLGVEYYSHWFSEDELSSLLKRHHFEITLIERRMARFIIQARAV